VKVLLRTFLFFLLITLVGVYTLLHSRWLSRLLAEKANATLAHILGIPVEVSWIRWEILTNTIVAGDTFWRREGDLPWMEIPWAEFRFGWLNLSFLPLRVQKITLISPRIRLKVDERGNLLPIVSLLEKIPSAGGGRGKLQFEVEEVEMVGGEIEIELTDPPSRIALPRVYLQVKREGGKPVGARIQFEKGRYQLYDWRYEGLSGEVRLLFEEGRLILKEWKLHGDLPALDLAGSGAIHPGGDPILDLGIGGMADLSLINLHYTSHPEFVGTALLSVHLLLNQTGIHLQGEVYSRDVVVQGNPISEFFTELELNEKGIDFPSIRIATEGGRIMGTGMIRWEKEVVLRFSTEMEDADLGLLTILLEELPLGITGSYRGKMNLDLKVDPILEGEIRGTGTAHLQRLILVPPRSLPEFPAEVTLSFHLSQESLTLDQVRFSAPEFSGWVSGRVPLSSAPFTLSGKVSLKDLAPWVEFALGIPAEGEGEITFALEDHTLYLDVYGSPLTFFTARFDRATAQLSVKDKTLEMKAFSGEGKGGRLTLKGTIALDTFSYDLQSTLVNLDLSSLGIAIPIPHKVNGVLSLEGSGTEIPRAEGTVDLAFEVFQSPIEVSLTAQGDRIEGKFTRSLSGNMTARKRDGTLYFDLRATTLPFRTGLSPQPVTFDLSGEGNCTAIQPESCFVHLFASAEDLPSLLSFLWDRGELSLIARFQGSEMILSHPRGGREGIFISSLEGEWYKDPFKIELGDARISYHWPWGGPFWEGEGEILLKKISGNLLKGVPFEGTLDAPLKISRGKITLPPFPVSVMGGRITISGVIPWNLQGESQLILFGTLPAEILTLFWENSPFHRGEMEISLNLSRILPFPSWKGTITLKKGEVAIPGIDERIANLEASVVADQNLLRIESYSGDWGEGRITGTGRITLYPDPLRDLELKGRVETKRVVLRPELTSGLSGNLTLTSQPNRRLLLSGDLELYDLSYRQKILLEQMILRIHPRGSVVNSLKNIPLDFRLHLFAHRSILAETNLFEGPFQSDLWIMGNLEDPQVTGNLRFLPEGTITFRNRVFRIRRGIVQFSDPRRFAPYLDLEAETTLYNTEERQRYLIRMQVYGPYDNLAIKLTSDPPLEELDIFSLISLGVLSKDIGRSQTKNIGQTGGVEAANLLLLTQISSIEEELKGVGGFDLIEIQPYYVSFQGSSSILLSAEKRITPRLRLRAGTTLDPSGEQRLELGYDFNRNFHLLLGWDNRTPSGTGNFSVRPRLWFPLP
jgi:hypothetical protein